jgi:hypothetical protein
LNQLLSQKRENQGEEEFSEEKTKYSRNLLIQRNSFQFSRNGSDAKGPHSQLYQTEVSKTFYPNQRQAMLNHTNTSRRKEDNLLWNRMDRSTVRKSSKASSIEGGNKELDKALRLSVDLHEFMDSASQKSSLSKNHKDIKIQNTEW